MEGKALGPSPLRETATLPPQADHVLVVFFLGLIPQGIRPSQHRTALPSVIASGLSQAREVRQPRD